MKNFLKTHNKKSSLPPPWPVTTETTAEPSGPGCCTGLDPASEDRENPAPRASTSRITVGTTVSSRDELTVGGPGDHRGGGIGSAGASSERARKGTPLDVKEATGKFGPLKVVLAAIPASCADDEGSVAVGNKVEILLSHIVILEESFGPRPGDVVEQMRRNELIPEIERIREQLGTLCERARPRKPADHVQGLFRLLEDLQEMIFRYQMARQTSIEDQESKRIGPAQAAVLNNFRQSQQAEYRHCDNEGCLKGTRSTVLDEIELWTRDPCQPPIYWLSGLAGTGKTTIARTIAERMFAQGRLGASFFCSRDFEDRSDIKLIFPTLAVQLASKYVRFRSTFVPLVQSDLGIAHESLYGQMSKLIVQPLVKSDISTVIVIDALDECEESGSTSIILSVLGKFVGEMPKVKFLVTGHLEPRTRKGLELTRSAEGSDVIAFHTVESSRIEDDLRLFFGQKLSELKGRRRGLGGWPTEEQLDLLCERAAGLFLYFTVAIRFIDQNKNPKKLLDLLLQSSGRAELEENESTTVDSLYRSILQEAFRGCNPEEDSNVRSVLGAVVLAKKPLSPSTIAALLGVDPDDVSPLLSLMHPLLIFGEGSDRHVRPLHKTFPDFITDPRRCTDQRFRVCPSDQHANLLVSCLELMNKTLEQNMCKLPDGVTNSEVDDLKERARQYIDEGLEYACRSWHKHIIGNIPRRTQEILHQFLTEKYLFWLEVVSVLGASRNAVDALEATAKWLDVSPTLDLARDCSRFLITFFDIISTSASHIYISALPLSPRTSMVREIYKRYERPLVRVVHGLSTSWGPVVATVYDEDLYGTVWSPCNRFIAVATREAVEIRDAVTLALLNTFESPSPPVLSLNFSPDSRFLARFASGHWISWDLKTGESVGVDVDLPAEPYLGRRDPLSVCSIDGKVVAVVSPDGRDKSNIVTYDRSATRARVYPVSEGRVIRPIWTHGEFLRFAAAKSGRVTIWEVDFALALPPVAVKPLPTPDEIVDLADFLFLPTLSRLGIAFPGTLLVWDARDSKLLLKISSPDPSDMSFSSDGLFFACLPKSSGGEVCVWKESLSGYVLHQQLAFASPNWYPGPFLSPDGASVIVCLDSTLHLWHTKDPILSGRPIPDTSPRREFVLEFSPTGTSAAFTGKSGDTVTILGLQSGDPRLLIDAGVEVRCLGLTGTTIVVAGEERILVWNVTAAEKTRVGIDDSVRIATFDLSPPSPFRQPRWGRSFVWMLVSPDLTRIVTSGYGTEPHSTGVEMHDAFTGRSLAGVASDRGLLRPWFTSDGREIWGINHFDSSVDRWEIIEDDESGTTKLQPLGNTASPPGVPPWQSSRGYKVTDDGWILSPTQKRLLWLPREWRSYERCRIWSRRFLGLRDPKLPEVVIMECID